MSSSCEEKKITLVPSDGGEFEAEEEVAMQMQTIKHMIEDGCAADKIPLPNLSGSILSRVLEYAKKHVELADNGEAIKAFDTEFMQIDQKTLFELMLAANYLDCSSLLDLTCQTVADRIKRKTPEEIRKIFNIKNDFSPEEEEKAKKENRWAYESLDKD